MPIIEILLIIVLLIREYFAYKERQEMLDRLMSKDLQEYKVFSTDEPNQIEEDDDSTISILDAVEEFTNGQEN